MAIETEQNGNLYENNPLKTDLNIVPIEKVRSDFDSLTEAGEPLHIRGRIIAVRDHKKTSFFDIQDSTGRIQVIELKNIDEPGDQPAPKEGDLIEIAGTPIRSKTGEQSIGLSKRETIASRQEELGVYEPTATQRMIAQVDGITFDQKKFNLAKSIALLSSNLRNILNESGFLEFETPTLKNTHEAGTSRPFVTKQNSKGTEMYLRLTMEAELKKLLSAGFPRVYEMGKSFRNEGEDKNYLPEFSVLEAYTSYADYKAQMDFFKYLMANAVLRTYGTHSVKSGENRSINFNQNWETVPFKDIRKELGKVVSSSTETLEQEEIRLMKKNVVPELINPTFIVDLPSVMSPFAKKINGDPKYAERAIAVVSGKTFCDLFTDETDPNQLIKNLRWQDENLKGGEHIRHQDNQIVEVTRRGMPPSASFGLSMNRLRMVLNNLDDVRDTVLFFQQ